MRFKLFLIVFILQSSLLVFGQIDSTKKVLVTKHDGGQYIGFLLSDDGREILIETEEIGKIYIPKHLLRSIKELPSNSYQTNTDSINNLKDSTETYGYRNFMSTKYIQGDNAFPLRKGESFLKFMPLGMEGQFYLKENWSMGAMTSYIGAPIALRTKWSIPFKDSNYFSLDVIYGSMMFGSLYGSGIGTGGGALSAGLTFGDRSTNYTVKTGFVFLHEEVQIGWWDEINFIWNEGPSVVYGYPSAYASFSGMTNVGQKSKFVFDLFAGAGTGGSLIAAGGAFRFGPKPKHLFQLGLTLWMMNGFFFPLPVINFSYSFILPKFRD